MIAETVSLVSPAVSTPRLRSLWPREHGAYGQLGLPLLTALLLGRPTVAALSLTVAFCAAFVAHESLLVVLGLRGGRAKREAGDRATRWLVVLGAVAALGGAVGVALGGAGVGGSLGVSVALGAALGPFILRRKERTLGGELLAVGALSSTAVPVGLAAGAGVGAAVMAAGVWALGHGALTVVIRGVIAHARGPSDAHLALRALGVVWLFLAVVVAHGVGLGGGALVGGLAPLCGLSLALAVVRPPARYIKVVGWVSVLGGVLTTAVLVGALR